VTFIGILLALAAERVVGHLPRVGEPMVLEQFVVRLQRLLPLGIYWRSWAAPVVLLAAGTAGAAALDWWIRHPLGDLAYGTVVLFLCLGPRDLGGGIHRLIEAYDKNDFAAQRTLTLSLLRIPGPQATRRSMIGALFIQSHERLFGVLLWFFAAGPAGAVLYRLASRMPRFLHETRPDTGAEQAASRCTRRRRGRRAASTPRCSGSPAASTRRWRAGARCAARPSPTGASAPGRCWPRCRRRR
jgi:membrane protein required for beta-lactamase induction